MNDLQSLIIEQQLKVYCGHLKESRKLSAKTVINYMDEAVTFVKWFAFQRFNPKKKFLLTSTETAVS